MTPEPENGRDLQSYSDTSPTGPAYGSSRPSAAALRFAWMVALATDAIQLSLPWVFGPGLFTAVDVGLDVLATIVLTRLLGWHWAFVPTFVVELLPLIDLVPTWTAAVWIVSRRRR